MLQLQGNSLIKAIKAVSENGGLVKKAYVIVDRDEGAIDNLKKEGIELEPIVSVNDFYVRCQNFFYINFKIKYNKIL